MSPPAAPPASASDPLTPPDAAAVARFRDDVAALLTHTAPAAGDRLALAISGGADSMAMLLLAAAAFSGRVIAATVDHGLRAQAAEEAALVARQCARLDVPHTTLTPDAPIRGSSIQMRAREARYAALTRWANASGTGVLLTAHHADDQAETLLMRLNRGSGISGLSSIRAVRVDDACTVIRPLLGWRRAQLRAIMQVAGVPWVEDPSNDDPRHDRTRYRALLAAQPLLSAEALAASAAHLAEAEAALGELTEGLWAERWHPAMATLNAADLPREVRRRLVRRAIALLRERHGIATPHFAPGSNVEALLDSLAAGRAATQAGIHVIPDRAGAWRFALAPARRSL